MGFPVGVRLMLGRLFLGVALAASGACAGSPGTAPPQVPAPQGLDDPVVACAAQLHRAAAAIEPEITAVIEALATQLGCELPKLEFRRKTVESAGRKIRKHLAAHPEEGLTVICSLHDIDLVERYATRLVALRDGRLVWEGQPSDFNRDTFKEIYGEDAEPASNTGF